MKAQWEAGMVISPDTGPCRNHLLEVVNPSFTRVIHWMCLNTQIQGVAEVEAIAVRCRDCYFSWFPPIEEKSMRCGGCDEEHMLAPMDIEKQRVVYRPSEVD